MRPWHLCRLGMISRPRPGPKDLTCKAKSRTQDCTFKAKVRTDNLLFVLQEALRPGPRPRTNITGNYWSLTTAPPQNASIIFDILNSFTCCCDYLQVGFVSGSYNTNYKMPWSNKPSILNLAMWSNVGIPGRWMYRVDQSTIILPNGEPGTVSLCGGIKYWNAIIRFFS
jgi:Nidogen-like